MRFIIVLIIVLIVGCTSLPDGYEVVSQLDSDTYVLYDGTDYWIWMDGQMGPFEEPNLEAIKKMDIRG